MKCNKCGKDKFEDWKNGITYEGLDEHHNPPEFISEYLKEKWSGEYYSLCRKCHRELHDEIIKIMNKKAETLKFIKSEYWVMQRMSLNQLRECKKEIYDFTNKWLEKKENDTNSR